MRFNLAFKELKLYVIVYLGLVNKWAKEINLLDLYSESDVLERRFFPYYPE